MEVSSRGSCEALVRRKASRGSCELSEVTLVRNGKALERKGKQVSVRDKIKCFPSQALVTALLACVPLAASCLNEQQIL